MKKILIILVALIAVYLIFSAFQTVNIESTSPSPARLSSILEIKGRGFSIINSVSIESVDNDCLPISAEAYTLNSKNISIKVPENCFVGDNLVRVTNMWGKTSNNAEVVIVR